VVNMVLMVLGAIHCYIAGSSLQHCDGVKRNVRPNFRPSARNRLT
jgi:hypothetical protein